MIIGEDCEANFRTGVDRVPQFFQRLGSEPDFRGKTVLDVGCGTGSLVVFMGQKGAARVLGIDTDAHRIEFAKENLRSRYPDLVSVCGYEALDVNDLADGDFDLVTAWDSFEHIADLRGCLKGIAARLKPGGQLYAGFGPLYNSPKGDHGAFKLRMPWGHLIIPEHKLIAKLNESRRDCPIQSVHDLGLNKLSLADYKSIFRDSGLETVEFRTNCNPRLLSRIMTLLAKIGPLEEYCTHAVFCVLRKPSA